MQENHLNETRKLYIYQQSCLFRPSCSNFPLKCKISFYDNRTLQIRYQKQNSSVDISQQQQQKIRILTLQENLKTNKNQFSDFKIQIKLNLNYIVEIVNDYKIEDDSLQKKLYSSIGLIISDYRNYQQKQKILQQNQYHFSNQHKSKIQTSQNNLQKLQFQKYYIQIQHLDQQKKIQLQKKLFKYFQKTVWIRGLINTRYQLMKRFQQKNLESYFFILRDVKTFQNHFVKCIKKKNYLDGKKRFCIQKVLRQIQFQNMIKHKNIMRYVNFLQQKNQLFLFFQQKPIKSLSKHIQQTKDIKQSKIKSIFKQLTKVLFQLSNRLIVHKNIKSSSVFIIQNNNKWKICLAEFQNAQYVQQELDHQQGDNIKKSLYDFAPQLRKNNQFYNFDISKSDMFNLGLLFYQVHFNRRLYEGKNVLDTALQNEQINFQAVQFRALSKSCIDLLKRSLIFNPKQRISAQQSLRHRYFGSKNREQSDYYNSTTSSSILSCSVFQTLLQQQYLKKRQTQDQVLRNRYFSSIPTNRRSSRTSTYDQGKEEKYYIPMPLQMPSQTPLQEIRWNIDHQEMNDSHIKFQVKDARIMKPSRK